MKKVAVLTDFGSPDPTYSLNIIAEEQLAMLTRAGYTPVGIVEQCFKPERAWCDCELRTIPAVRKSNSVEFHDGWEQSVAYIRAALDIALADIHVVITHDLIYQCAELWLNYAVRDYAAIHPDITWLNWVHSATPSPVWLSKDERLDPVQHHLPHSFVVFPNDFDVPRIARNFYCEVDQVAVVPHPTDICAYLGFQDITRRLVYDRDLLAADVIMVYPVRLDRGKQVEYLIGIAAQLKAIGRTVRIVIPDFHSTGGDKVTYRAWLKDMAVDGGLVANELTFLSEYDTSLNVRTPREVVRDLMLLCNVFVMPSRSETYSLIAQEAALCGAFLILNRDFPPFRSIYGPHAAYYQFSSNINALSGMDGSTDTKYDNTREYLRGIALRISYELDHNDTLAQRTRIRQTRNPDYIFRHFVEPLFHAQV